MNEKGTEAEFKSLSFVSRNIFRLRCTAICSNKTWNLDISRIHVLHSYNYFYKYVFYIKVPSCKIKQFEINIPFPSQGHFKDIVYTWIHYMNSYSVKIGKNTHCGNVEDDRNEVNTNAKQNRGQLFILIQFSRMVSLLKECKQIFFSIL